ncbi:methylated-DNA--[protein]-cysteine S-methyltransferase [bacterium]|nr:MAG: methylated-DNA--[protein]-cysteine S-methyltransferase [bacterium]
MEERIVAELRSLRARPAPATLLPAVLERVGLADRYWREESAVGPLFVAFSERGISAVVPALRGEAAFEREHFERFHRRVYAGLPPRGTAQAVARRLAGDRRARVRFDLRGCGEFQRAVLEKALEIPLGEVRPYGWVAREIGRPQAVRAVGSALGGNPVPLLVPCHRVVRTDGSLGEYALGSSAKRLLLEGEGVDVLELERLARCGERFVGSDTTHVYCLPSCVHARRISGSHRVAFSNARAAALAEYRPCRHCRPAPAA